MKSQSDSQYNIMRTDLRTYEHEYVKDVNANSGAYKCCSRKDADKYGKEEAQAALPLLMDSTDEAYLFFKVRTDEDLRRT